MKARKLMGSRLQIALLLFADGNFTDREIARQSGVKLRTLEEAKQRPYFPKRVNEIRQIIARNPIALIGNRVEQLLNLAEKARASSVT